MTNPEKPHYQYRVGQLLPDGTDYYTETENLHSALLVYRQSAKENKVVWIQEREEGGNWPGESD